MILSNRHRFVVLAPWKTASSTTHRRLSQYNESPYSRFFAYNPYLQRVVHQHITYSDFMALPESRCGYYSCAFVRNPYDRVYSGFLQLQRDMREQLDAEFPQPWIKTLVMRQIDENRTQLSAAEFDFDRWVSLIEESQIYEVGRNTSFPLHPGHYWTGTNRDVMVDFVGKTETFERDFCVFCNRVGIEPSERGSENVTGDIIGSEPSGSSRYVHRMSAATISKINALFDADFELFGYEKR